VRPDLASMQAALFEDISSGTAVAPETFVVGDARATAGERLNIYAYMYRARLLEALEATYPRLARVLGHAGFEKIAHAYVADNPSRNPSLRFLGAKLPDWVEKQRPKSPWLADLARLEWARNDVFDAPDQDSLTLDALRGLEPDDFAALSLTLIEAHRLVTAVQAAAAFWDAAGADESFDPTAGAEEPGGEMLVVWRQEGAVYHRVLSEDEAVTLELMASGTTFGSVCELLASRLPIEQAATRAFAWLSTWTADGLLAA
jgi:hypothetical protein